MLWSQQMASTGPGNNQALLIPARFLSPTCLARPKDCSGDNAEGDQQKPHKGIPPNSWPFLGFLSIYTHGMYARVSATLILSYATCYLEVSFIYLNVY